MKVTSQENIGAQKNTSVLLSGKNSPQRSTKKSQIAQNIQEVDSNKHYYSKEKAVTFKEVKMTAENLQF